MDPLQMEGGLKDFLKSKKAGLLLGFFLSVGGFIGIIYVIGINGGFGSYGTERPLLNFTAEGGEDYQTTGLRLHNIYRKRHLVPALALGDHELHEAGVKCAEYYADKAVMDYTCSFRGEAGENLYIDEPSEFNDTDHSAVINATNIWYLQNREYNYASPHHKKKNRNFIQMLPQFFGSKLLGMGIAKKGNLTYVVALYSPKENIKKHLTHHIFKPK